MEHETWKTESVARSTERKGKKEEIRALFNARLEGGRPHLDDLLRK